VWRYTKDDNALARQWAQKAVELDPKSIDAHTLIGWTYFSDFAFRWGKDPVADLEHLYLSAQKAIALDDSDCGALALMTRYDVPRRQFEKAIADGERAVRNNPNCTNGYTFLADTLIFAGRPREALAAAETAIRLDPAGQNFYAYDVGRAYIWMGRAQEGIPFLQRHAAAFPSAPWAHWDLAIAYAEVGRDREARDEIAELKRISPQFAPGAT
jgi:adenylate cyclase